MILNPPDFKSPTWLWMAEQLRHRHDAARDALVFEQTEAQTAALRAQIQMLRELLQLEPQENKPKMGEQCPSR